jgi:outer membrane protein assembly factor BamB
MRYCKPLPSQDELLAALDYDPTTGVFLWKYRADRSARWNKRWAGKTAGSRRSTNGYVYIRFNNEHFVAQRLALVYVHGSIPTGHEADHSSLARADNRIENLRPATRSQNKANGNRYRNARGLKGAYRHPAGYWRGQIRVNGKTLHLGCFQSAEEAHAAYAEAAEKYFGAFARP